MFHTTVRMVWRSLLNVIHCSERLCGYEYRYSVETDDIRRGFRDRRRDGEPHKDRGRYRWDRSYVTVGGTRFDVRFPSTPSRSLNPLEPSCVTHVLESVRVKHPEIERLQITLLNFRLIQDTVQDSFSEFFTSTFRFQ